MDLDEQLIKKNKTKQYDMKIIQSNAVNTLLIIKSFFGTKFHEETVNKK